MTDDNRKDFGKRVPPPVVLQKSEGARSGDGLSTTRKRSLAVSLALIGALSLGAYEIHDWIDSGRNCEPDPANPDELICKHGSGGGGGGSYRRSSRGWGWFSGYGGSSSTHGVSYGGFGKSGDYHSSGG
jgi:hypothetical protein